MCVFNVFLDLSDVFIGCLIVFLHLSNVFVGCLIVFLHMFNVFIGCVMFFLHFSSVSIGCLIVFFLQCSNFFIDFVNVVLISARGERICSK